MGTVDVSPFTSFPQRGWESGGGKCVGIPVSLERSPGGADRQRRASGKNNGPGRAMRNDLGKTRSGSITVEIGTNVLAGTRKENILRACDQSIEKARTACVPDLWDGKAAERIWRRLGDG